MGLLTSLLTLPVMGPWKAGRGIFAQVIAAAEAELYDEDQIIAQLRLLSVELDEGRISEEEHAAAEASLLERLVALRAARAEGGNVDKGGQ